MVQDAVCGAIRGAADTRLDARPCSIQNRLVEPRASLGNIDSLLLDWLCTKLTCLLSTRSICAIFSCPARLIAV